MNCPDCDREVHGPSCSCGWAKPGPSTVIFRSTEHAIPDGITKEEFGLDLFRAIYCVGGIIQLRKYREKAAMGDLPANDDYLKRETKLIEELRTVLVHLKPNDVTDMLDRYPWIATL